MKKLFIIPFIFTSCLTSNKIYYSENNKKCIHNLETMMTWLQQDYRNGDIPRYVADNYMLVLQNTRCSLYKKEKIKNKECTK